MNTLFKLLLGAAALSTSFTADAALDTILNNPGRELSLNEVIVTSKRPVLKQQEGKLIYIVKNDPFAKGLDGINLLGRLPRVSVNNGSISVAGKGNVRYIIDGILMELDPSAMAMRLQDLRAEDIEKVELLTTPPSRYAAEPNAVYISITTRNESLGTKGNIYASLNQGNKLREYLSAGISNSSRKWDLSLDASLSNYSGINENSMEYTFKDNNTKRISHTENNFHSLKNGYNALIRYKINSKMNVGVIANYNYSSHKSDALNTTIYGDLSSSSKSHSKERPNNALTLTGFLDWNFGAKGEALQLTYNYFNRHSPVQSDITTVYDLTSEEGKIHEESKSTYRFHSAKIDFRLPCSFAQFETGVAYTDILNSSSLSFENYLTGLPTAITDRDIFDYSERIAALYLTASRSLGEGLFGKVGVRYEYTYSSGRQMINDISDKKRYGRLFPSANISWNRPGVGSFNLSYSMGMGRPNLWELNPYKYYSTTDEYAAGNPGLKPTLFNNAEINYYGLGGLYAVLYTSFASDAIGYIRRAENNGTFSTMPYNCLSTNKTGLYTNYKKLFFDRWEVKIGGEVFRTYSSGKMEDYKIRKMADWSGKLEVSTNLMLNRKKTLIFSANFTHLFPYQQNLVKYESLQLFNVSLRYSLLNNRMSLQLRANDIFGWNKTRSKESYAGYSMKQTFNGHTAYVLFSISYRFGRDKVNNVWRASKEEQAERTK